MDTSGAQDNRELLSCDVLVIGTGIAGATTAWQLGDAGHRVLVITKAANASDNNTNLAQGGIIYRGEHDSPQLLAEDIFRAGAHLNNPEAVRVLAEQGPATLKRLLLDALHVQFDRDSGKHLALCQEAAHRQPRIIHVADATGKAIQSALLERLQTHPNITPLHKHCAIDLLTPDHHSSDLVRRYQPKHCVGAYVLDTRSGQVKRVMAKATVLATGGLGQIFLHSTNARGARGDGLAMANRAGARIINSEFIQFHPTAFHKAGAPAFLISEAVRGAGARLVHADGEPFMHRYAPEWGDLAPRDVVARAIHQEMTEKDVPNVYLDLASYLPAEKIRQRFPTIDRYCRQYGIDITRDNIPVTPAAHYSCGGVWVDIHGRSSIENLYAVGETACTGVHGANRLASTSLLEGLTFGALTAAAIDKDLPHLRQEQAKHIPPWRNTAGEVADPELIAQDLRRIQSIMWHYVGLRRNAPRLARALRELRALETEIEQFYRNSRLTDDLIGLRNAVRSAVIVTQAAWSNKHSIGCHYREDAADDNHS